MNCKWIIFASSILLTFTPFLIEASYGRLILDLLRAFPTASMATLQWSGSMVPAIGAISVWQSLVLIKLFGYRLTACIGVVLCTTGLALASSSGNEFQLLLSYGIMFGNGGAFLINVALFIVAANFPPGNKFHVFTTSCMFCVFPLAVIAVPISDIMVETFGWRKTYLIYACTITILGLLVSIVYGRYKESKDDNEKETTNHSKNHDFNKLLKKKMFTITAVRMTASFCEAAFLNTPIYILSKHAQQLGFEKHQGAYIVSFFGITEGCTRLLTAIVGDRLLKNRTLIVCIVCFFLGALVNVLLGYTATTYTDLIIYSVTMGALGGPVVATSYSICGEMLVGYYTNELYSLNALAWGVGVIVGMSTEGIIFDFNNSFKNVYIFMAAMQIATALLNVIILLLARNLKHVLDKRTEEHAANSLLDELEVDLSK